jgi:Family of unknown function (DUF6481)
MAAFKVPTFQERTALAQAAKQKALEKLKAKPQIDPAILAERNAARLLREAADAEARIAKLAAREQEKAEKAAQAAERAAAIAAEPEQTAAEKKAARDARYAARKQRKR